MIMLSTLLELARWRNLVIIMITFFLLSWQIEASMDWQWMLVLMGTVVVAAAGNVINDILDIPIDLINKPEQVRVGNQISINEAKWYYYSLLALVGYIAYRIEDFFLVGSLAGASLLLYWYSRYWKKKAFIGNLVVALLCAWVVVEVWWLEYIALERYHHWILGSYTAFAFLTTLIREIVKDMEDWRGDQVLGSRTLPIWMGIKAVRRLVLFLLFLLGIVLLAEAYFLFQYQKWFAIAYIFVCLLFPMIGLGYAARNAQHKNAYHQLSTWLKWYMLLGLGLLGLL